MARCHVLQVMLVETGLMVAKYQKISSIPKIFLYKLPVKVKHSSATRFEEV